MSPAFWRWGAVIVVCAGVAIGALLVPPAAVRRPASAQAAPLPPVATTVTGTAAATPAALALALAPAPLEAVAPALSAPASASASASPDDLPRLRTRELVIPVAGMPAARLTDTYTQARANGVPHEAIDIMAPRGTPVLAVEDGRVVKLFLSKAGGITLYQFDPGGEFAYYYAHLDAYAEGIQEGAELHKGQVIAYVGSTGNAAADAPHLHFAIFRLGPERQWWRGTALNPFPVWRDATP